MARPNGKEVAHEALHIGLEHGIRHGHGIAIHRIIGDRHGIAALRRFNAHGIQGEDQPAVLALQCAVAQILKPCIGRPAAGLTGVEGKPDVSGVVLAGNQLHGGAILLHVDKSWLTRQNGHVDGQTSG